MPPPPPPPDTPPVDLLGGLNKSLDPPFRLDNLVALSKERALYHAWDRVLKRPVALRVHLMPGTPGRAWFLRETETLAALDHPAIRHVYAASEVGNIAYRTANWVDGESLAAAMRRGPRPIPMVMSLARDLLSALEHAHARGIIMRRIVPTTLMLDLSGRAVITDLRYANWCLELVAADADPEAAVADARLGEAVARRFHHHAVIARLSHLRQERLQPGPPRLPRQRQRLAGADEGRTGAGNRVVRGDAAVRYSVRILGCG